MKWFISDNNGSVTFIAIVVLLIVTIIAVAGIKNTTTELQISRNERLSKLAFFAAEAARGYVVAHPDLYGSNNIDPGGVAFPSSGKLPVIAKVNDTDPEPVQFYSGTVEYVTSTATMVTPRGSGYQVGKFRAHWYRMQCIGEGPDKSLSRIEQGFYRIGL